MKTVDEFNEEIDRMKADKGIEFTSERHRAAARSALLDRKDELEKLRKKCDDLHVPTSDVEHSILECQAAIDDLKPQLGLGLEKTPIEKAAEEAEPIDAEYEVGAGSNGGEEAAIQ